MPTLTLGAFSFEDAHHVPYHVPFRLLNIPHLYLGAAWLAWFCKR